MLKERHVKKRNILTQILLHSPSLKGGFPGGSVVKNPSANAGDTRDSGLIPGLGIPWRRKWQPIPVFLPGQRSLVGCSSWGRKEVNMTEHASMHHLK